MSEQDRIVTEMIAKLEELEELYRSAELSFQDELKQASGLSADLLHDYRETLKSLQTPSNGGKLFATLPEAEQKAANVCPQCSAGTLEISTSLEPASQRGHVMIVTHYTCRSCGYQDQDKVSLPTEIALQQHNLEALMNGL